MFWPPCLGVVLDNCQRRRAEAVGVPLAEVRRGQSVPTAPASPDSPLILYFIFLRCNEEKKSLLVTWSC